MTHPAITREGLQKIDVKIGLDVPAGFDFDTLLEIFGRWRLEEGEGIIDLADYLHVPDGPGCLLVSHRWHFGIDRTGGVPGLFLSNRDGLEGTLEERYASAIRTTLEKGRRLLDEPSLSGLSARPGDLQVAINDRVRVPNTDESDAEHRAALENVLGKMYGADEYTLERDADPAARLSYTVRASASGLSLGGIIEKVG